MSVSVTVINNCGVDLEPSTPIANAQTNGNNSSPPATIRANSNGSGGIFRGNSGITSVTVYSTPDPNYIWVLFCNTPPNATQTVKTAFFPTGTMVDQNLVQDVQDNPAISANATHKYATGGASITLGSRGTAGRGTASPSPTFQLNYTMSVNLAVANKLTDPISPATPTATAQLLGANTVPPAKINANGKGSGGTFEGPDGITAISVYSIPDPNTVWVLFVYSPVDGAQAVKTAFYPASTSVDQNLVQDIQSTTSIGPNSTHSYTVGGAPVTVFSRGTPGGGSSPSPSFEIDYTVAVGVTVSNKTPVDLNPATPVSNVQTAGQNAGPPTKINANSQGSGGTFSGASGITTIIVYSTPDPNTLWVLYFKSPPNAPQTVKTSFVPSGTTIDQKLVQDIEASGNIGPDSAHTYTTGGISIILDSRGTPGGGATPSPSFEINYTVAVNVNVTNNLAIPIEPAKPTANAQTVGSNVGPPTTINANSTGSGGTFGGANGVTAVSVYSTPDPNTIWVLYLSSQQNAPQAVKTAFYPAGTTVDQNLVRAIESSPSIGPNSTHSYMTGGVSVTLDSRATPGGGTTPAPSFEISYAVIFGVTITNNLPVNIDPATPTSHAETAGTNTSPPTTINTGTSGSGGIFKGTNGITCVIVYTLPDPNYIWVLFINSPRNGAQTVKTAFYPVGTTVDQNLVRDIQDSSSIGPDSTHTYTIGGGSITINSRGTPGSGATLSPSFEISLSMTTSVTVINNLSVPIQPATPISNAATAGNNASPPTTVNPKTSGSGGIFRGSNGITAVTVYTTPDPATIWVLFFNSQPNGTQSVKTTFKPAGTTVDQNLVQDVQDSSSIGENSSHFYTTGGVPVTLDSRGTPGRGSTPSPSFQINYRGA